jgi:hypothetical protein
MNVVLDADLSDWVSGGFPSIFRYAANVADEDVVGNDISACYFNSSLKRIGYGGTATMGTCTCNPAP